jgi:hypothetical protein
MVDILEVAFGTRVFVESYGQSGEVVGFAKSKVGEPETVVKVQFDDGFENWYRPASLTVLR